MLFIVEGIDRTGKTTLCESQPVHTRSKYMHFSAPEKHPLDEYIRPLEDYVPGSGADIWIDRHYLGEAVWPRFFNRETMMDRPMRRYIELFLESRGAVCIIAEPPTELEDLAVAGEPIEGRVREAVSLFDRAVADSTHPWLMYCYECNSDPAQFDQYGRIEEGFANRIARVTERWVGSPTPDVVLVGEQVGPTTRGWQLPFVPYKGASGHFLMEELQDEALHTSFALINAFQPGRMEHEPLEEFVAALGGENRAPKVVGLGNVAAAELKRQGVEHQKVPHPQYWRRFERRQGPGAYRKLIMEAAS